MHIYADWEITCTLSEMHKSGPARGTSVQVRDAGSNTAQRAGKAQT